MEPWLRSGFSPLRAATVLKGNRSYPQIQGWVQAAYNSHAHVIRLRIDGSGVSTWPKLTNQTRGKNFQTTAREHALSFTTIRDNSCQNWWLSCDRGRSQLEKKGGHMEESRAEILEKWEWRLPSFWLLVMCDNISAYCFCQLKRGYLLLRIKYNLIRSSGSYWLNPKPGEKKTCFWIRSIFKYKFWS